MFEEHVYFFICLCLQGFTLTKVLKVACYQTLCDGVYYIVPVSKRMSLLIRTREARLALKKCHKRVD